MIQGKGKHSRQSANFKEKSRTALERDLNPRPPAFVAGALTTKPPIKAAHVQYVLDGYTAYILHVHVHVHAHEAQ